MTFGKAEENLFIVRLERGEDVLTTLKTFCQQQSIKNASFVGIGSIENPTLAHYKVDTKHYSEKQLEGVFEVTSLLGTAALFENEPLLHLHITVGDEQMHAFAGHLVKGNVSATMEVQINVHTSTFVKKHNDEIGLNLYDFPSEPLANS